LLAPEHAVQVGRPFHRLCDECGYWVSRAPAGAAGSSDQAPWRG